MRRNASMFFLHFLLPAVLVWTKYVLSPTFHVYKDILYSNVFTIVKQAIFYTSLYK